MDRSGELIFAWLDVLDELTYYELFAVAPDADADDVRAAFHVFCDTFHPDRHFARPQDERNAVATIFKRATEAYVVLSDAALRTHYDAQLSARPSPRPVRLSLSPHSRPPSARTSGPPALDESVRSPSARPFARRAEELIANHMDPDNETLQAALRDLEAKLSGPK